MYLKFTKTKQGFKSKNRTKRHSQENTIRVTLIFAFNLSKIKVKCDKNPQ